MCGSKKRRRSSVLIIHDSESEKEYERFEISDGGTIERQEAPCRSSERIREKQSRRRSLPSRKDVWDAIPDQVVSQRKLGALGCRSRKLANSFSRVSHRYNQDIYDPCLTDESSLSDFLDDGDDEKSSDSIDSAEDDGRHINGSQNSEECSRLGNGGSSSDDEVQTKRSVRQQTIESDSDTDEEVPRLSSGKKSRKNVLNSDDSDNDEGCQSSHPDEKTEEDVCVNDIPDNVDDDDSTTDVKCESSSLDDNDKDDSSQNIENQPLCRLLPRKQVIDSDSSESELAGPSTKKSKRVRKNTVGSDSDSDNKIAENCPAKTLDSVNAVEDQDTTKVNIKLEPEIPQESEKIEKQQSIYPTKNSQDLDESCLSGTGSSCSESASEDDIEMSRQTKLLRRHNKQVNAKKMRFQQFLEARKKYTPIKK